MTPTQRCAAAIAGLAICGALIGPVGVVIAAVAFAGLLVVDALSLRERPVVSRELRGRVSRGIATPLVVEADRAAVLLRQPLDPSLEIAPNSATTRLEAQLVAHRRGRHTLAGVGAASIGTLGLLRRHHRSGPTQELLCYPDVATAQRLITGLRRGRSPLEGKRVQGQLGLGTDFDALRDYLPDDDIRQVNWRATARLGRPMSNQYRVDQDRDVICLLDCGRLMSAPLGEMTRLDAALDALTVIALAADELGDRFGVVAFDSEVRCELAPRSDGARTAIDALFDLQARSRDSDFEFALRRVERMRRALVIVFTDLIDEAAARSLIRAVPYAVRHHAIAIASTTEEALVATARAVIDTEDEARAAIAAIEVLETARRTATVLRGAGATVIEAPPGRLGERCLGAYLRAKELALL